MRSTLFLPAAAVLALLMIVLPVGAQADLTPTATGPSATPTAMDTLPLDNYADGWQDAIGELEQKGIIAPGGSLIFEEDSAYFAGQGNWFTALAVDKPHTDIVMAGELTFRAGSTTELESCSLVSRIAQSNREQDGVPIPRTLDVGIDNEGDIFYLDFDGENPHSDFMTPINFSPEAPHHFLILARNELLSVYVDGRPIVENVSIDERAGTYGIALRGRGPNAMCQGRNIWAYQAPLLQPGECEITTSRPINKRRGPGTSFDRAVSSCRARPAARRAKPPLAINSFGGSWTMNPGCVPIS